MVDIILTIKFIILLAPSIITGPLVFYVLLMASKNRIRSIAATSEVTNKKLFWLWQKSWLSSLMISISASIAIIYITMILLGIWEDFQAGRSVVFSLSHLLSNLFLIPMLSVVPVLIVSLLGLVVNVSLYYSYPTQYISQLKEAQKNRTFTHRLATLFFLTLPLLIILMFLALLGSLAGEL